MGPIMVPGLTNLWRQINTSIAILQSYCSPLSPPAKPSPHPNQVFLGCPGHVRLKCAGEKSAPASSMSTGTAPLRAPSGEMTFPNAILAPVRSPCSQDQLPKDAHPFQASEARTMLVLQQKGKRVSRSSTCPTLLFGPQNSLTWAPHLTKSFVKTSSSTSDFCSLLHPFQMETKAPGINTPPPSPKGALMSSF